MLGCDSFPCKALQLVNTYDYTKNSFQTHGDGQIPFPHEVTTLLIINSGCITLLYSEFPESNEFSLRAW